MTSRNNKHRKLASIGNYQLMSSRLGEGSFSKVELVNHMILNKRLALKVINMGEIEDPYVRKNLHRESAIMSKLNHPNVVRLYEVCSHVEFFCLAMDHYSGGNLCDLVCESESSKLEEKNARVYYHHIVNGLNYIHKQGIIHRDIKLENIFLTHDKSVAVIGDFGLSNFWNADSHLKTRCGSLEYAAPELLEKRKYGRYDQAIDIWSSGVVLYAMLTGQLPFNSEQQEDRTTALFDQIKKGLIETHMNQLKSVSFEARSLLNNVICVGVDMRFSVSQIKSHSWFLEVELVDEPEFPSLNLHQQMEVARTVQKKLKLMQWQPEQILAHVMSTKGKFGKTAGCFNILARDLLIKSRQQSSTVKVNPPVFKLPSSVLEKNSNQSSIKNDYSNVQPQTEAIPGPSFWDSGKGKAAVFALSKLKPARYEDVKSSAKSANNKSKDETEKPLVVKPFFQPDRLWRRSANPASGHICCRNTIFYFYINKNYYVIKNAGRLRSRNTYYYFT